jgi:glutamate racemase
VDFKPIGVFDSGFGGLSVLKSFMERLPQYDFLYLGDNSRAPYGSKSFETVYEYTRQCVQYLFAQGCPLVIIACNTASSKALRTIQQIDLPNWKIPNRVLGIVRPTAEVIGIYSKTGKIGILGTEGTINSNSYVIEIQKFFPETKVFQTACPVLVPLIEDGDLHSDALFYYVKKYTDQLLELDNSIDVVLLACTHYPLIQHLFEAAVPHGIRVISQGEIVAESLLDYLQRHYEINSQLSKQSKQQYLTTDSPLAFNRKAALLLGKSVVAQHVLID